MGKMKLFICPPPRAGPVQACPSHFTLCTQYIPVAPPGPMHEALSISTPLQDDRHFLQECGVQHFLHESANSAWYGRDKAAAWKP